MNDNVTELPTPEENDGQNGYDGAQISAVLDKLDASDNELQQARNRRKEILEDAESTLGVDKKFFKKLHKERKMTDADRAAKAQSEEVMTALRNSIQLPLPFETGADAGGE